MSTVLKTARPNDYLYDPTYIVSGPKDFYKQAYNSKISTAQYAVCPIFSTMFSDLRNYPRKQYVIRRSGPAPEYIDKIHEVAPMVNRNTLVGTDRHKYFHNPVTITPEVPKLELSCFYAIDEQKRERDNLKPKKGHKQTKVQTVFRESSAQTSPWEPDYTVIQGDPELLKLDFLKWGSGLPAGMHEITLIERARMKRKWEKSLPSIVDGKTMKKHRDFIEELARDEWVFREQEIEHIQGLRMELLEKMLNEIQSATKCRTEKKMRLFADLKLKEKKEKLYKLHKDSTREKRRLDFQYRGILSKYSPVDVVTEHSDFKSELYVPLIRHGNNPKYGHEILEKRMPKYKPQYMGVEKFNTMPTWLRNATDLKKVKLPGTRLCIRETKWTTPVLKLLHEELKNLSYDEKKYPNLRVQIEHERAERPTPDIGGYDEREEEKYQATVFLQKILRGRASQFSIFEGRERCRELINELRSNHGFLQQNAAKKAKQMELTKVKQQNAMKCTQNMKILEDHLKKIGGYVTGTLLDFLNKELNRLYRERKIHAMALMVERERMKREAAEAGRRQKELRRRKEHDEIFKQVIKVHQDTVDLYLEDIITEGMQFASEEEAHKYVTNLAKKVDIDNEVTKEKIDDVAYKEEYIANLVHHFVIPEVEKKIVRQRNKKKQQRFLRTAHSEIYGTVEKIKMPASKSFEGTTGSSEVEYSIDYEQLKAAQSEERRRVLDDIQDILQDLIMAPVKESIMKNVHSCKGESDVEPENSSTASSLQLDICDITTVVSNDNIYQGFAYQGYPDIQEINQFYQPTQDDQNVDSPNIQDSASIKDSKEGKGDST